MVINYKRLFNISFLHDYYSDGVLPDVSIIPTKETIRKLKNLNLIFKSNNAGNNILFKTSDDIGTPLLEVGEVAIDFVFTIHTRFKAEFQNITNLDQGTPEKDFVSGKFPLFENDAALASNDKDNPEEIVHELIDQVKPKVFTYTYTLDPLPTPDTTLLKVTDPEGNEETIIFNETSDVIPNDEGVYSMPIDLADKQSGKYVFTVRNQADDTDLKTETIYLDNDLASSDFQGIIKISYDPVSGHLFGDTEYYGIKFIRKQTKWVFYVANKNGNIDLTTSDLSIEDASGDDLDSSIPYGNYSFSKGVEPDPNISINGYDTVVFTSVEDIPFYQRPKLHLNLKVDDDVIIENLPNPPLGGVSGENSEIFVFV